MFTLANINGLNGFVNGICGFRIGDKVNMMHLRISGFDGGHCSLGCRAFEIGFVTIVGRLAFFGKFTWDNWIRA